MFYSNWQPGWLAVSVTLAISGSAVGSWARPATPFLPHLERIRTALPEGLVMRLPTKISLRGPSDIDESKLVVRVFPSETPVRFTVSLFTCEQSVHPCLLGSFSVDKATTASAQRDLQRHQTQGAPITLIDDVDVKGYLLEGPRQTPSYGFSTLMWQQEGMIYTISFPAIERETILSMAISMARGQTLAVE